MGSPDAARTPEEQSALTHRALAHPTRHRLLMSLRSGPATISQLARRLETHKGNVAHHLRVLADAGMVHNSQSRQVRGGTEQYFEVMPYPVVIPDDDVRSTTAMLGAVASEIATAEEPLLHLRHVRLSPAQAAQLRAALEAIVTGTPPANATDRMYAILVGLYSSAHQLPDRTDVV